MDEKRKQFEANNWVRMGKSMLQRDDIDKAVSSFNKALKILPDYKEAKELLLQVEQISRERESRRAQIERSKLIRSRESRRAFQETRTLKRSRARQADKKLGPVQKRNLLQLLLKIDQLDGELGSRFSQMNMSQMNPAAAGQAGIKRDPKQNREALQKQPPKIDIEEQLSKLISEGIQYLASRDFRKAKTRFSKATKEFPESYLGWMYLGDTHVFTDNLKSGIKAHKQAAKLEPACNFPRVIAKAQGGIVHWNIELVSDHAIKELWVPQTGIITEEGPRTFGSNHWSVKFPENAEAQMERTYSLWTLRQQLHPDAGANIAINQAVLHMGVVNNITSNPSSIKRDDRLKHAMTLESYDKLEDACNEYSALLISNPMDSPALRGLYRIISRLQSGEMSLESFHKHPLFQSAASQFHEMKQLLQSPHVQKARKSMVDKYAEYEILQLQMRSFDYLEKEL